MKSLAQLLRARRAEILLAWERSATADASLPDAKRDGPLLRAHIPDLLDALTNALESPYGKDEVPAGRNAAAALLPHIQATERRVEGYSMATVLRALGHLREQIIDLCLIERERGDLDLRGIRFVHAALDECMCVTAVEMERAEAAEREHFVAVLGHDLRTPLNAIKMAASLMLGAHLTAEHATFVQKIVRAADRMNAMIGALLDFAAVRSGALELERSRCDLQSVCGEVLDELRLAHADRTLTCGYEGDCEGCWDAQRMAQVVSNLIGNALTYSPAASAVVVAVRGLGPRVEIEVHNDGAPIPVDQQSSIFAPFKRGLKRKSGGLGLGLFIAQEMVRAHGGAITFRSVDREGTTFTVNVPRNT